MLRTCWRRDKLDRWRSFHVPSTRTRDVRRHGAAALAASVLVIVAAACSNAGSGSGPSTSSTAPAGTSSGTAGSVSGLPIGLANAGASSKTQVTYTSRTVAVPAAMVRSDLVGVSGSGSTYTFSSDSGPLAQLAPGKVMLLEGFDVAVVASVDHAGGDLVVHTTPATITDLVQSGTIAVSSPSDFASGFGAQVAAVPSSASTSADESPNAGDDIVLLGAPTPAPHMLAFAAKANGLGFKIAFDPEDSGVRFSGTFCYQLIVASGACAGSRTIALSLELSADGAVYWDNEDTDITVSNGAVTSSSFSLSGLRGDLTLNWQVARGTGGKLGADIPVIKIPFEFEFPLCPVACGVPLYAKFGMALLVKLAVSAKNGVIEGGTTVNFGSSSDTLTQSGQATSGSGSGDITGSFNTSGTSLTLAASAAVIAMQLKACAGLGILGVNALGCLSFVTSVGQTTGSADAGQNCSIYQSDLTLSGFVEAQLLLLTATSQSHIFANKTYSLKQPGC
ncbi:MAG: hypothetical protein WB592_14440 [Acidimicrobiales bacterium]